MKAKHEPVEVVESTIGDFLEEVYTRAFEMVKNEELARRIAVLALMRKIRHEEKLPHEPHTVRVVR